MSQPWVPHHQHPSRAAWYSRWAVLQLAGWLFLFLFRHFPGPLDEIAHNSSFKEVVFADGRSNTSVTLVTAPAVGRALSKLTQLSSPARTLLWTSIHFLKAPSHHRAKRSFLLHELQTLLQRGWSAASLSSAGTRLPAIFRHPS